MADSDFSFATAAAPTAFEPAPTWVDDAIGEGEVGLDASSQPFSTPNGVPSQNAAVEEELLNRFKDQLEAVMEDSLGPLLASGGALDPELARKIARETSAFMRRATPAPHSAASTRSALADATPARPRCYPQCWRASATRLRA